MKNSRTKRNRKKKSTFGRQKPTSFSEKKEGKREALRSASQRGKEEEWEVKEGRKGGGALFPVDCCSWGGGGEGKKEGGACAEIEPLGRGYFMWT